MAVIHSPPTLQDLEQALNAQTEVLQRVLAMQAMQGEMLAQILTLLTDVPKAETTDLEATLRALFALSAEHADRLADVVTLLKAGRT